MFTLNATPSARGGNPGFASKPEARASLLYPAEGLKARHLSLWPEISSAEAALRELRVIGAQMFEGRWPAGGS